MGMGFGYKCSKCGEQYSAGIGVGFLFPQVYRETLEEVKKGKYGEEWKRLALSDEYVAVDAEEYIYVCGKCGFWESDKGLSLYTPKNVEDFKKKEYGIKTVEEWGEVPYVMNQDLIEDYRILKKRIHNCSKCGNSLHIASLEEIENLTCPVCGGENDKNYSERYLWD